MATLIYFFMTFPPSSPYIAFVPDLVQELDTTGGIQAEQMPNLKSINAKASATVYKGRQSRPIPSDHLRLLNGLLI